MYILYNVVYMTVNKQLTCMRNSCFTSNQFVCMFRLQRREVQDREVLPHASTDDPDPQILQQDHGSDECVDSHVHV